MNKPIAIFLLLTGGMAQATPFLEVDLVSSVASTASVKVYRKGKTKCGRFSGKTSHVTRESSANTDLDLTLSGEPSSTTVTGTSGASSATTGNWRKARENTAEAKIAVDKGSTSVALNLEDKRFFDDAPLVESTDGRCTSTYSQWRFHSPTISGKVRIGFVMPQDT